MAVGLSSNPGRSRGDETHSIPAKSQSLSTATGDLLLTSFPLSSIKSNSSGSAYPPYGSDWRELSLPGVHSDIGGGYGERRQFANRALEMMHQQAVARGVPFGPIPTEYLDTDTNNLLPHDSRWINDNIGDYWNWLEGQTPRPREIYYYPWQ